MGVGKEGRCAQGGKELVRNGRGRGSRATPGDERRREEGGPQFLCVLKL